MNLRHLEAFRAVMLSGSVTQAAQSLNLSQPAVSKMLAELEHQLGFQLFLRSRGSALTVTPEADAFFYEVERSFSGIAALKRVAEDIRNMATGTLRIAALPALAVSFLPRVIAAFRETHPGVTVQLKFEDSKGDAKEGVNIARKFSDDASIVAAIGVDAVWIEAVLNAPLLHPRVIAATYSIVSRNGGICPLRRTRPGPAL